MSRSPRPEPFRRSSARWTGTRPCQRRHHLFAAQRERRRKRLTRAWERMRTWRIAFRDGCDDRHEYAYRGMPFAHCVIAYRRILRCLCDARFISAFHIGRAMRVPYQDVIQPTVTHRVKVKSHANATPGGLAR